MKNPGFRACRALTLASAIAAACCFVAPGAARAQDAPIQFELASDVLPNGSVQVSNGRRPTRLSDWNTLVFGVFGAESDDPRISCTAILVGPHVLLTAAHCFGEVGPSGRRALLKIDAYNLPTTCDAPEQFRARANDAGRDTSELSFYDIALCLIAYDDAYPPPVFSRLDYDVISGAQAEPGDRALFLGYGCQDLHWGAEGRLTGTPIDKVLTLGEDLLQEPARAGFLETVAQMDREAALCPGDSGGPLFTDAALTEQSTTRRIGGVAVGVRGESNSVTSWFAPTATPEAQGWMRDWITRNANPIVCGVNRGEGDYPCRD